MDNVVQTPDRAGPACETVLAPVAPSPTMAPSRPPQPETEPAPILVYGDWIVDDYWFLVSHQSDISSHTGFRQYRIATKSREVIRALCGAGHIARTFHRLQSAGTGQRPHIVGLGAWNDLDTEILSHLVHSTEETRCECVEMAYWLHSDASHAPPGDQTIKLVNLPGANNTIRVIRPYRQVKGKIEQIGRIDWEPPHDYSDASIPTYQFEDLPEQLAGKPDESEQLILVEDFLKGAVTPGVIQALDTRYPNACWFIRTKNRNPDWLTGDVKRKVRLLVIGPELASLEKPWKSWLSQSRVTAQALTRIQGYSENGFDHAAVVILTDTREVIARLPDNERCITGTSQLGDDPLADIGWASAFFAALSWQSWTAARRPGASPSIAPVHVANALKIADNYGSIKPPPSVMINRSPVTSQLVHDGSWPDEKRYWEESQDTGSDKLGIVQAGDGPVIELWRGSSNLPGYVTCIPEKLAAIDEIGRGIREFTRQPDRPDHYSILLRADPGAGKTYLAQSLAREFDYSFLSYDIAQMMRREDLLQIFDGVEAQHTENLRNDKPDRSVLVFVDEINARLENSNVYSSFLAPLEGGYYLRNAQRVYLKPCIWIFAGTDPRSERVSIGNNQGNEDRIGERRLDDGSKIEDFLSRITLKTKIDLSSLIPIRMSKISDENANDPEIDVKQVTGRASLFNSARLEQVYIGVMMLNKLHPDVRLVERDVLYGFWKIDPTRAASRVLRNVVRALRNVQDGVVLRSNWGENGTRYDGATEQDDVLPGHRGWLGEAGRQLVNLQFQADQGEWAGKVNADVVLRAANAQASRTLPSA